MGLDPSLRWDKRGKGRLKEHDLGRSCYEG